MQAAAVTSSVQQAAAIYALKKGQEAQAQTVQTLLQKTVEATREIQAGAPSASPGTGRGLDLLA